MAALDEDAEDGTEFDAGAELDGGWGWRVRVLVFVGCAFVGALEVGLATDVDDDGGDDDVGESLCVGGAVLDDGGVFERVLDLDGEGDGDVDGGFDVGGGGGGASMVNVSVDRTTVAAALQSPMIWWVPAASLGTVTEIEPFWSGANRVASK